MADRFANPPTAPLEWPIASAAPSLGRADVHVWAAPLDLPAVALEQLAATLSPEELARASRFRFPRHRNRFIAGRGFLRGVLGQYLASPPAQLHFAYGPFGKPCLDGGSAASGLEFNLSHSEDLGLLAVTRAGAVGVDIEQVRLPDDADELVNRFFSRRESTLFGRLPPALKPLAFFNLWTRKEAWLKATGEGIGQYLNRVEVSFLPLETASLIALPENLAQGRPWHLEALAPAPGFAAALAIAVEKIDLQCWTWADPVFQSADSLQPVAS